MRPWLASSIAFSAALLVLAIAIHHSTFAAADSDPYGYVSQADLIAHGSLRVEQEFVRTLPWPRADWTFSPPGYRPAAARGFIAPTYAPGLPLVMALFERISGRDAVFYVVPLLGAWAIWMTGQLGARVHSPLAGVIAAVLLATSPAFLYEIVQPVSDVPATAWWTMVLAFAVRDSAGASFVAGAAASMAILTRPNLVPLAAVVGVFVAWPALSTKPSAERRAALVRVLMFSVGTLPGCVIVAAINRYLFGSPLQSGYGPLTNLYAWSYLMPNLARYPRWLVETETPFIFLAFVAPAIPSLRMRRTWLLLAFTVVVLLSYFFYVPWGWEEWSYVRFLLPAYPAMLVLGAAVTLSAIRTARAPVVAGVFAVVCIALPTWRAREGVKRGAFITQFAERRYVDVGRYIAAAMPRDAVFVAGAEAGSIRYYSSRLTLRYDQLQPGWLDEAVNTLRAKGYHPYIALEEAEEPDFRQRFAAANALGQLDWPPTVQRSEPIFVRIYDPADRARFVSGEAIVTGDIGLVKTPTVTIRKP